MIRLMAIQININCPPVPIRVYFECCPESWQETSRTRQVQGQAGSSIHPLLLTESLRAVALFSIIIGVSARKRVILLVVASQNGWTLYWKATIVKHHQNHDSSRVLASRLNTWWWREWTSQLACTQLHCIIPASLWCGQSSAALVLVMIVCVCHHLLPQQLAVCRSGVNSCCALLLLAASVSCVVVVWGFLTVLLPVAWIVSLPCTYPRALRDPTYPSYPIHGTPRIYLPPSNWTDTVPR
jgi:hypothetical protein